MRFRSAFTWGRRREGRWLVYGNGKRRSATTSLAPPGSVWACPGSSKQLGERTGCAFDDQASTGQTLPSRSTPTVFSRQRGRAPWT